jgi:hypothetical protein
LTAPPGTRPRPTTAITHEVEQLVGAPFEVVDVRANSGAMS